MGRCSDARDRLLATSAALLHERGYTAVSVSDICKAAGLKKGSFYHFFESKHALVLATLDRFAERQRAQMQSAGDHSRPAREQLESMFIGMYEGYLEAQRAFGCSHGCAVGNLAQEMAHRDAQMRAKLAAIFSEWKKGLAAMLQRAHTKGELVVADPDRAAEALLAYLQGTMLLAKAKDDPDVFLRLAGGLVALAEADLKSAPRPADVSKNVDLPRQVSEVLS